MNEWETLTVHKRNAAQIHLLLIYILKTNLFRDLFSPTSYSSLNSTFASEHVSCRGT